MVVFLDLLLLLHYVDSFVSLVRIRSVTEYFLVSCSAAQVHVTLGSVRLCPGPHSALLADRGSRQGSSTANRHSYATVASLAEFRRWKQFGPLAGRYHHDSLIDPP